MRASKEGARGGTMRAPALNIVKAVKAAAAA
jgi:hypothetical protein